MGGYENKKDIPAHVYMKGDTVITVGLIVRRDRLNTAGIGATIKPAQLSCGSKTR